MKECYGCSQDCPVRSPSCHSTCDRYLAAWEKQRRENEQAYRQSIVDGYMVREIRKAKSGRYNTLAKFRPKERQRG